MRRLTSRTTQPLDLYSLLQVRDIIEQAKDRVSRDFALGYIEGWLEGEIKKSRAAIESVMEREA